ncbi:hypothetical protein JMJ77_0011926, partial [Colletotrichum scovillei]
MSYSYRGRENLLPHQRHSQVASRGTVDRRLTQPSDREAYYLTSDESRPRDKQMP